MGQKTETTNEHQKRRNQKDRRNINKKKSTYINIKKETNQNEKKKIKNKKLLFIINYVNALKIVVGLKPKSLIAFVMTRPELEGLLAH